MGSGGLHLKMAMMNNLLLLSSIFATVPALPPAQPTTTTEASVKSRTNGLINDVKEINLFLNIPKGCDIVYDGLIKQDCANTALFFPVVKAEPTPPEVPCNGTYCPTSGKLIFSGDAETNVAFPQEEEEQAPRDQVSIGDLLGGKPTYGSIFDEQRDGPRFG